MGLDISAYKVKPVQSGTEQVVEDFYTLKGMKELVPIFGKLAFIRKMSIIMLPKQLKIMRLFNTEEKTYQPIFYFEHPFPGGNEENSKLIRYHSKGHRTTGFADRQGALDSIKKELVVQIKEMGHNVNKELDRDIMWDGVDIPADNQLRVRKTELL